MALLGALGNLGKVYNGYQNAEGQAAQVALEQEKVKEGARMVQAKRDAAMALTGDIAALGRGAEAVQSEASTATPQPSPGQASVPTQPAPPPPPTDAQTYGAALGPNLNGGGPAPQMQNGGGAPGGIPPGAGPPPPMQPPPQAQPAPPPPQGGQPQGAPKPPPEPYGQMTLKGIAMRIMTSPGGQKMDWRTPENQLRLFYAVQAYQDAMAPEQKAQLAAQKGQIEMLKEKIVQQRADEQERHNREFERLSQGRNDNQRIRIEVGGANTAGKEGKEDKKEFTKLADKAATMGISVGDSDSTQTLRTKIAEAALKKSGNTAMDEETLEWTARAAEKDPAILSRLGTGQAANANKIAVLNRIAKNNPDNAGVLLQARASAASTIAEAGVVGKQIGNTALGIEELKPFSDLVLQSSNAVDRTEYSTVNKIIEAAEKHTGGKEIITLGNNLAALKNAYTQILIRGGANSVDARKRVDDTIDVAWSKGQIETAINALNIEGQKAFEAAKRVQGNLGKPGSPTPAPAPAAAIGPTTPQPQFAMPGMPVPTMAAIQRLREKDSPEERKIYDGHFGKGAADKAMAP